MLQVHAPGGPPPLAGGERAANSFIILVRHFFDRFFDNESLSPQAEAQANLGPLLALIAVPGAFVALLIMPLMIRSWSLVSLRYCFVSLSMVVIGFMVVLKWDVLFPDRRDYQILTPLPIRLWTLFSAKAMALGLFVGVFLVDVNFFSTFFSPGLGGGNPLRVMVAHATAVTAAGIFAALAAASIQGVLVTLLWGSVLRRVSVWLQAFLMGVLVMLFFLTTLIGPSIRGLIQTNSPWLYYFPGFWFVGLYELLLPATNDPVLASLGYVGIQGLAWAAGICVVTYLPGYRRHARKVLEAPQPNPAGPGPLRRAIAALLDRTILRHPVERGVFHFITQTIARSMKHRIFLAAYGGFGAALAVINLGSGDAGLLALPLTLSFILVSGLRAAFNFPSELRANWAFQVSEGGSAAHCLAATRKWILVCGVLPLFGVVAPLHFANFTWKAALFHIVFGVALSALLVEVMFWGFRKVPFTCSYFPGKINLVGLSALYVFGFTMYSRTMSSLGSWIVDIPAAAALFLCAVTCGAVALGRCRARDTDGESELDYEDDGDPEVRTLGLASWS